MVPAPAPFLFFRGRPHNISLVRTSAAPFLEIEDEPEFRDTLDEAILEGDAAACAALFAAPAGAAEVLRDIGVPSAELSRTEFVAYRMRMDGNIGG